MAPKAARGAESGSGDQAACYGAAARFSAAAFSICQR
jgi:hypothetical protein